MEGRVYRVRPQPPVEEDTQWLSGGVLRIGVEYRNINPANLSETYRDDPAALSEIEAATAGTGPVDAGVSIHVCGVDDGHEYLRFDMFDDEPHYHYIWPEGDHNHIVPIDVAACDVMEFAFSCLRHRLDPMLRKAHGGALADRLNQDDEARLIDEVEELALRSRLTHRSIVG
jgi:hypothetical protein